MTNHSEMLPKSSPCCDARVQVVYVSVQSIREAVVFACLKCSRLHVVDSRDQ